MDDQISIIEGPPPTFEKIESGWVMGLNESANQYDLAVTHLRTFNGPALVERCHKAWRQQSTMYLNYRNRMGLEERAPIFAARNVETPDGHMLLLWVRRDPEEVEEDASADSDDQDHDNDLPF
jgi:hypothetical protein